MNMGNIQSMMKKAQKLQKEMEKEQKAIQETIFEVQDINQLVTVKVNGKRQLTELLIQPELVDPDDIDMLQDLVLDTINDALAQVDEATEERLSRFTQGMNLPF